MPGRGGDLEAPEQFLWQGRLWRVRDVVAHWVETGPWWHSREVAPVLREVDALGELDNTIVLFTSDNGASREGEVEGTTGYYVHLLGETDVAADLTHQEATIGTMTASLAVAVPILEAVRPQSIIGMLKPTRARCCGTGSCGRTAVRGSSRCCCRWRGRAPRCA